MKSIALAILTLVASTSSWAATHSLDCSMSIEKFNFLSVVTSYDHTNFTVDLDDETDQEKVVSLAGMTAKVMVFKVYGSLGPKFQLELKYGSSYSKASIEGVDSQDLAKSLEQGRIVVSLGTSRSNSWLSCGSIKK